MRMTLSTHGRECPIARCKGGRLLQCTVSTLSSLHTGENIPLLVVEGGMLSMLSIECLMCTKERVALPLLYTEETVSSPHRGEIVPLLYVEAADSSSIQVRECILYTVKGVPLCYL